MPTFSNLHSSLTGSDFYYERSPRHATYNFNQGGQNLYYNHPRFPFEFYVSINLDKSGGNAAYVDSFLNGPELQQLLPLVKSIDMPSIKIETTTLNQYNRKRISQTAIKYDPVKMICHDVVDGKTLQFWEMYYRYYFADGNEPGKNSAVIPDSQSGGTYSVDNPTSSVLSSTVGPSGASTSSFQNTVATNSPASSTNTNGNKSGIQNIISNTLDNHNFGFNLPEVGNVRNLIKSIDIYQVHGGKFNQVTLVNPRISAFTHDTLNYAVGDKTLEMTFTFEYEYAYYTIQNLDIGGGQSNNTSEMQPFLNGDFLELQTLAFTATGPQFVTGPSPQDRFNNSIIQSAGSNNNVQSSLQSLQSAYQATSLSATAWASDTGNLGNYLPGSIANRVQLFPKPYVNNIVPVPSAQSFVQVPIPIVPSINGVVQVLGTYPDVNRTFSTVNRALAKF